MASENVAGAGATVENDGFKFGFERPEMYESKLAGSIRDYDRHVFLDYDRHVFLCYKSHETWPSRVETSESDLFPKLFAAALKARKDEIKLKEKLSMSMFVWWSHHDLHSRISQLIFRKQQKHALDKFLECAGKRW